MRCRICGKKIGIRYFITGIGPECANKLEKKEDSLQTEVIKSVKKDADDMIRLNENALNGDMVDDLIKNKNNPKKNKSAKGKGTERVDNFLSRVEFSKSIEDEPLSFQKISQMYQHGVILPSLIEEIREAPNSEWSEATLKKILMDAYNKKN